ncbi:MAG: glycosyltransferase [uncultured bacterium]|uniref:Glycosyl transferase n=1 Tax=candidate division WWE3 bacterium TaxID=2053526 RepID=A0A656PPC7_UNCKA|nr:glycosyltransferase [candidate division WWE3 bacterium RAAC2_WWE3_1]EKD95022.1 MAG: glycosyltransferase [uncultured bacterium]KKS30157.1 MAG: Glycosyltransferase [candidate division WWE3 bacterium GW2011_GWB1_42_117]KKS55206.1 MAG: Glycosyltransferase [candidate division WWE3 bacterium GW2011_GWD2_42_34]KKT05757.1 MAG: Glycosyltransferase [candidate division WWE3 bacterium GW2011_GWE2_43_18]KKT07353.1 MAG: Glycosyltransferase [candidate division WWE3 bacterium GW2011_GWF2_43_18]KKT09001.1 
MNRFSIIIPVRKFNEFLKENISHLKELTYRNFEVIIVTDEKENYDFQDSRFILTNSGPIGPGEKRNLGAARATGDVLSFLDDDAYPEKDWLDRAAEIFENEDVFALGGPAITPKDARFLERMSGRVLESWMASAGTVYRHKPGKNMEIADYPTVNLFVRKDSFDRAGGFPVEFWPGEDTKLCLELVKSYGRKFVYDPRPVVYHHRRNLFIPHLKQISRYGRHRGQFARIFPETSRLPSYFAPSMFVAGLVLGPFISLFIPQLLKFYIFVVGVYLIMLVLESVRVFLKDKDPRSVFYVGAGIFLTHVVYGVNFIIGIMKKPELKLRSVDKSSGNYLGG